MLFKSITTLTVLVLLLSSCISIVEAKGGGRAGGARSSVRSTTRTTTSAPKTTSSVKPSTPTAPAKPKVSTRPSTNTQIKTTATPKTVNGKTYGTNGYVVGEGYQPRFKGYVPTAGDTVYYRSSAWDWFPFYYIMTHDGNKEAVVVKADGTEQVVKEEGKDGMYVFNWIIVILSGLFLIGLMMYLFDKLIQKKYA